MLFAVGVHDDFVDVEGIALSLVLSFQAAHVIAPNFMTITGSRLY